MVPIMLQKCDVATKSARAEFQMISEVTMKSNTEQRPIIENKVEHTCGRMDNKNAQTLITRQETKTDRHMRGATTDKIATASCCREHQTAQADVAPDG